MNALLDDPRVQAATFGVAAAVSQTGDYETGRNFYPSVQNIGAKLFKYPNSAQPHVRRLRELGYLTKDGTTRNGTVRYSLTLPTDAPELAPAPTGDTPAEAPRRGRREPVAAPEAPTDAGPSPRAPQSGAAQRVGSADDAAAGDLPDRRKALAEQPAAQIAAWPTTTPEQAAARARAARLHGLHPDEEERLWQAAHAPEPIPAATELPEPRQSEAQADAANDIAEPEPADDEFVWPPEQISAASYNAAPEHWTFTEDEDDDWNAPKASEPAVEQVTTGRRYRSSLGMLR
jgi:hypothetical protein